MYINWFDYVSYYVIFTVWMQLVRNCAIKEKRTVAQREFNVVHCWLQTHDGLRPAIILSRWQLVYLWREVLSDLRYLFYLKLDEFHFTLFNSVGFFLKCCLRVKAACCRAEPCMTRRATVSKFREKAHYWNERFRMGVRIPWFMIIIGLTNTLWRVNLDRSYSHGPWWMPITNVGASLENTDLWCGLTTAWMTGRSRGWHPNNSVAAHFVASLARFELYSRWCSV